MRTTVISIVQLGFPTAVVCLLVFCAAPAFGQQIADPDFDVKVAQPVNKPAKVLLDEAHNNFHTAAGRYQPFAALITNDGYSVIPNKQKFTRQSLAGYDVLVISNALGAPQMNSPGAANAAFTEEECQAVREWVQAGGALLLIADHAPMGAAASRLGLQFGVAMSQGSTRDPQNYLKESNNQGFIQFNRENGLLGEHAITRGRNADERINRVQSFTGQSLKGPTDSVAFLKLASTAVDLDPATNTQTSAAGRAQGIALQFAKGRVVVMGEAAMLSAQLSGSQRGKMGMNQPGLDNKQLVLNLMHWLTGILN
jgi:hypothetical protein